MHFNTVSVSLKQSRQEILPEYMQKYYNDTFHTNKTVKRPYNCSANHKICFCHPTKKGEKKMKSKEYNELYNLNEL
jgi:hypothetical protein